MLGSLGHNVTDPEGRRACNRSLSRSPRRSHSSHLGRGGRRSRRCAPEPAEEAETEALTIVEMEETKAAG